VTEPVEQDEAGDGRDEVEHDVTVRGTGAVDDPVAFASELVQRLGFAVRFFVPASQLTVGECRGDRGHDVVLLAAKVWQQDLFELCDGREQQLPLVAVAAVVLGVSLDGGDRRVDVDVVGVHLVEQVGGL
jgi:hypothetical protein